MNPKMKYLQAIPLVLVNAFLLSYSYFERANLQVDMNIFLLFLFISVLLFVSKAIFDFVVCSVLIRKTDSRPSTIQIIDMIFRPIFPQWILAAAGSLIIVFCGFRDSAIWTVVLFSACHILYYILLDKSLLPYSGKLLRRIVLSVVVASFCSYAAYNIIQIAQLK